MVNVLCSMSPVISEKNNRGINLLKQKWFGRVYLGFTTHHAVLESQISSGTSHVNGHWSEAAGEEAAPTSAQYIGEAKELFPSSVRSTKKKSRTSPHLAGSNGSREYGATGLCRNGWGHCLCRKTNLTPRWYGADEMFFLSRNWFVAQNSRNTHELTCLGVKIKVFWLKSLPLASWLWGSFG